MMFTGRTRQRRVSSPKEVIVLFGSLDCLRSYNYIAPDLTVFGSHLSVGPLIFSSPAPEIHHIRHMSHCPNDPTAGENISGTAGGVNHQGPFFAGMNVQQDDSGAHGGGGGGGGGSDAGGGNGGGGGGVGTCGSAKSTSSNDSLPSSWRSVSAPSPFGK